MPISAEKAALYPDDWKDISHRIRFERAKGRCEKCSAPHGEVVYRCDDGNYILDDGERHDGETGEYIDVVRGSELPAGRFIQVILTCAHVHDPDPSNCADDNLAAWCQRCHNRHDAPMRRANAAETRHRKKTPDDLFD